MQMNQQPKDVQKFIAIAYPSKKVKIFATKEDVIIHKTFWDLLKLKLVTLTIGVKMHKLAST